MAQPSPMKPERRVLGEKSINASLTPRSTPSSSLTSSKLARDMSSISPPVLAGQKRSIDQVDSSQNRSGSAKSSFSQTRREDEFYIYEENNTQSSTEADKQMVPTMFLETAAHSFDKASDPKNSSQKSDSMSSLLNLSFESENNNTSPRPAKKPTTTHSRSSSTPSIVPTDPAARKAFIKQKAGLLRNQLRFAMKNFKDPQIDRRLSDLEAHAKSRDRPSLPPTSRPRQTYEPKSPLQEDLTPKAKVAKLLPAPVLHPTDYSSRYAPTNMVTMPSSPPASATSEKQDDNTEMDIDNEATPRQPKTNNINNNKNTFPPETPTSPVQLSSPPHTGDSPHMVQRNAAECAVEQMLAKAKKGEAVDGLLKLMKTTKEYDNLDEWSG
ncbi:hypothetical protein FQN53_009659 [Emmonsiellopsis sp. PD_33]|nr:hypothetical protein FQN53_009659 [Emmonsiellopsis sp. PD_33]